MDMKLASKKGFFYEIGSEGEIFSKVGLKGDFF